MKSKNGFLKNWKKVLAGILVALLLITGTVGSIHLFGQPPAKIEDKTIAGQVQSEQDESTEETEALISPNVIMLQGDSAANINEQITSVKSTSAGVYVDVDTGTEVDNLGVGDIFFLDGSASTPFGEPYFGKVASIKTENNITSMLLETPKIDEVFDSVSFKSENLLASAENVTLTTLDGVTANAEQTATGTSNSINGVTATPLGNATPNNTENSSLEQTSLKTQIFKPEDDVVLSLNLDIFDSYTRKTDADGTENHEKGEASDKVYITPTGYAYHIQSCFHLKNSKTVEEVTLADALARKYIACKHCKPAVLDDNSMTAEAELKLEGSVGIKNLVCGINYDWDVLEGKGIKDLSLDITGDFVADAHVKGGLDVELGGSETEFEWKSELLDSSVKIQGLKEKAFPIAYYSVTQSITCTPLGNKTFVRENVEKLPISILIMVYLDIQGNLTFGVSANYNLTRHFEFKEEIFKDGALKISTENKLEDPNITWDIDAAASGEVDSHIGLSALIYIYNVNFLDIGIVKVGAEAEGSLALIASDETGDNAQPWSEANYYARIYAKLFDIDLIVKVDASLLGGAVEANPEADYSWTLLDYTIAEWGEKLPTRYNASSMKYNNITAQDNDAVYYKDEDGRLIMETEENRIVLYDEEFFTVCGIDESYIYFLKIEEGSGYTLHRVSKSTRATKELVKDVADVLYNDQENMYFVDAKNTNKIIKLNRFTLEEKEFAAFEFKVEEMVERGDGLYVVTKEDTAFSWFFGATNYYYLLNKDGSIAEEYGSNPEIAQYHLAEFKNHYAAIKMISGGVLRGTAQEVYWLSKDKQTSVLTECVSGWNYFEEGIFTVQNNPNAESDEPFILTRYNGVDGTHSIITEAESDQVIFTMKKSAAGDWYYFDQSETELILYRLDGQFGNKTIVKTFPLEEIKYSLTECGMEILDNCVYFYAIADGDKKCEVIKRYDLF